ncbi:MAG TPA: hypothetical protein VEV37_12655 [Bryobacteraceae bacterium]|nr:hypothetical protein [Bryobacteraceae bacterium]
MLFADSGAKHTKPKADLTRPLGFYWTEGRSGIGFTVDGIPPLKVGSALGIPSAPTVLFPDGAVLMPSLATCERLQGFDAGWTDVLVKHPGRGPEWRMVGNAVSVPVAEWVASRVKTPGDVLEFEKVPIRQNKPWPDAGWNVGEGRTGVVASDQPISVQRPSISEFRDASWARLSDRALDGFIERVREGGLSIPKGFLGALRRADRKAA